MDGGAKFKHRVDSAACDLLARPAFAGGPPDMILARAHSTRLLPWQPKSHRFPQSALVRQSLRGSSLRSRTSLSRCLNLPLRPRPPNADETHFGEKLRRREGLKGREGREGRRSGVKRCVRSGEGRLRALCVKLFADFALRQDAFRSGRLRAATHPC